MIKKTAYFILVFFSPIAMLLAQKNPRNLQIDWKTDKSKTTVELDELTVLMPPDGIPPIDNPTFWGKTKAEKNYFAHEPVIAIEIDGKAKAYPLTVLTFHEIINDTLSGIPLSATYCPLCNSSLVFNRRLSHKGETYLLDFGISGMLYQSNLVLYDRQTESWWQQFTGKAMVGKLAGAQLKIINSFIISLDEFLESYPNGQVLSTETGHKRNYGTNPYVNYDSKDSPPKKFFNKQVDKRLPAMERIVNIQINGKNKIYPNSIVAQKNVINDKFQGQPIVLFHSNKTVSILDKKNIEKSKIVGSTAVFNPVLDGVTYTFSYKNNQFIDKQTGSIWNITGKCTQGKLKGKQLKQMPYGNHFAFAWFAFYPDCEIYKE